VSDRVCMSIAKNAAAPGTPVFFGRCLGFGNASRGKRQGSRSSAHSSASRPQVWRGFVHSLTPFFLKICLLSIILQPLKRRAQNVYESVKNRRRVSCSHAEVPPNNLLTHFIRLWKSVSSFPVYMHRESRPDERSTNPYPTSPEQR
jgi:hypothetical protein